PKADRPPAHTDADAPPDRAARLRSAAEDLPECRACAASESPTATPRKRGTPANPPSLGEGDDPDPDSALCPRDEDDREPGTPKAPLFDQLKCARLFAAVFTGTLLFVDGEQWWEYQENHWRYAGVTVARAWMQHFLMAQPGIASRQITASRVRAT